MEIKKTCYIYYNLILLFEGLLCLWGFEEAQFIKNSDNIYHQFNFKFQNSPVFEIKNM